MNISSRGLYPANADELISHHGNSPAEYATANRCRDVYRCRNACGNNRTNASVEIAPQDFQKLIPSDKQSDEKRRNTNEKSYRHPSERKISVISKNDGKHCKGDRSATQR
ncbi:hypothetical protein SAMN06265222_1581 [Neorhodopirellula lusitana]|uniref:Uncharacterized protein n=1 Tax=Neorhodopirellula lusitana TaxID=445327 RepID=A0ABY1QW53_9BACT|nr:hypothetical protein SAMN06265222_1581 [Neorhodopirellula lusitana]